MTAPALMLMAWIVEACIGWPHSLFRVIRHPVVWIGGLINVLDKMFNHTHGSEAMQRRLGALSAVIVIATATAGASAVSHFLPDTPIGFGIEAVITSSFIASRSLYTHVASVARALAAGNTETARIAVRHIVGRDPAQLDDAGIARAGLESLAENTSDGVTAPLFWGALLGLPGIVAYKAINTLDSMIGHRTERHLHFGAFAARLDDIANFLPARLTGILFCLAAFDKEGVRIMRRDAKHHRSPNAGWPEAALAGALHVRLSGPRNYREGLSQEPWLNADARDPGALDMARGLKLYVQTLSLGAGLLAATLLGGVLR